MSLESSLNEESELTVNGRTRIQTLMELALSAAMVQNRFVQCDIQNDARCALESSVFRRSSGCVIKEGRKVKYMT